MEIDIAGVLERNKERLAKQVEAITKDQIEVALHNEAEQVIADAVTEFLEKVIKPEIKKRLVEMKGAILAGLAGHIEAVVAAVGQRMLKEATKNIAESYKFREIIKGLFD